MAESVVSNAVIKHDLGNFGDVFDELHGAQQISLTLVLAKLLMGHEHAAKHHRERMALGVSSLFYQTADSQTNFVKEKVFRVNDGVLELDGGAVGKRCACAFPCLDAWLVDTL